MLWDAGSISSICTCLAPAGISNIFRRPTERGKRGGRKEKAFREGAAGQVVWSPWMPPPRHAAVAQRWLRGSPSRCPHSQAGLRSSTTPSPCCLGVLAKVPFTVRQWELSPPQTPHLSSCFREPTSLSQPTCCHPRGEKAKRDYVPTARLCSACSPHLHHHHVPGCTSVGSPGSNPRLQPQKALGEGKV